MSLIYHGEYHKFNNSINNTSKKVIKTCLTTRSKCVVLIDGPLCFFWPNSPCSWSPLKLQSLANLSQLFHNGNSFLLVSVVSSFFLLPLWQMMNSNRWITLVNKMANKWPVIMGNANWPCIFRPISVNMYLELNQDHFLSYFYTNLLHS